MFRTAFPLILIAAPALAVAAPPIAITTESFAETKVAVPGSEPKVVLQKIKSTAPGTRVVFINTARNSLKQPAQGVVIDNKIDPNLAFDNSTDSAATLSVDGGKTYGPLATAKVRGANGQSRPALPQEVTNIRWTIPVIPAGGERRVSYVAVVK